MFTLFRTNIGERVVIWSRVGFSLGFKIEFEFEPGFIKKRLISVQLKSEHWKKCIFSRNFRFFKNLRYFRYEFKFIFITADINFGSMLYFSDLMPTHLLHGLLYLLPYHCHQSQAKPGNKDSFCLTVWQYCQDTPLITDTSNNGQYGDHLTFPLLCLSSIGETISSPRLSSSSESEI